MLKVLTNYRELKLRKWNSSAAGSRYPERGWRLYARLQVDFHALPMEAFTGGSPTKSMLKNAITADKSAVTALSAFFQSTVGSVVRT